MKCRCSTSELQRELVSLSTHKVGGIRGVAVENSIYSILSPEGFASILYKDAKMAEKASEDMKITAKDLFDMGVIEKIIPEYGIMTREKLGFIGLYMKTAIADFLIKTQKMTPEELICKRYDRFRKF